MSVEQSLNTQEATIATSGTNANLPVAPESVQNSILTSLGPMVLIFGVFYFLLIRPQEKKRKAQEQLISTVKAGEEVLLHSGIYGKVTKVNENDSTMIIQVAENTEMKVMQSAIVDIISRKNVTAATAKTENTKLAADDKTKKKGTK